MGRALIYAAVATVLAACSPRVVYVPVKETRTVTETKHDTIVSAALPAETVTSAVRDTTATAETSAALAVADYDGAAQRLTLTLRNKTTPVQVRAEYVERIVRDSIPYPVEVLKEVPVYRAPWYTGILAAVAAVAVLALLLMTIFARLKR